MLMRRFSSSLVWPHNLGNWLARDCLTAELFILVGQKVTRDFYWREHVRRVSAANEARDRNNPTNAVQIRLQASLIRAKDCVILPQLSAPLGLRQGPPLLPP